ncbi:MAG: DUF320 domain-containing protein [Sporichthyaceae bacterium]|nr:DUF320 domain-containing protein [Sporichthyaceae bacterium]
MRTFIRRSAVASLAAAALVLPSTGAASADDSVLSYNAVDVAAAIPITVCGNTIAIIPILSILKSSCEALNLTKVDQGDEIEHSHHTKVVKVKKTVHVDD